MKTIVTFVLLLSTTFLWADDLFLPQETLFKTNATYPIQRNPTAMNVADINGDGLKDIVVSTETDEGLYFYMNRGRLKFEQSSHFSQFGPIKNFKLADFDGDGAIDIWIIRDLGGEYYEDSLWLNDGQGNFTQSTNRVAENSGVRNPRIHVADMNGNGAVDVLRGDYNSGKIYLYTNNGQGEFIQNKKEFFVGKDSIGRMQLGDYDNDGFLDVWVLSSRKMTIYLNEGGELNTETPVVIESTDLGSGDFILDDFNNNGLLDIQILRTSSNIGLSTDNLPRFINHGNGVFKVSDLSGREYSMYGETAISINFNDDKLLDLWVVHEDVYKQSQRVLTQANGKIDYQTIEPINEREIKFIEKADFNNDGNQEVVTFGHNGLHVWKKQNGEFALIPQQEKNIIWLGVHASSLRDINGDGHADLIVSSANGLKVALGNGRGDFGAWHKWFNEDLYNFSIIDLNQDGYGDLLYSGRAGDRKIKYALNNQKSGFYESKTIDGATDSKRFKSVIINDKLYVLIFGFEDQASIYIYSEHTQELVLLQKFDSFSSMEFLDLNNDGVPEVVGIIYVRQHGESQSGESQSGIKVYSFENDGFTEIANDKQVYHNGGLVWADFNNDGKQQLLVDYRSSENEEQDLRLLSLTENGLEAESFDHTFISLINGQPRDMPLFVGDINQDNQLDYMFINFINDTLVTYLELSSEDGYKLIKINEPEYSIPRLIDIDILSVY